TASTMACVTEALGMMLPGAATAPAVSADRLRAGVAAGRRAVGLAHDGPRPSALLTRPAFDNALKVLAAISGSTNAVIHLTAIARGAGVALTLDDFDRTAARTPLLVDCKPAGSGFLDDLHRAGGVPALLKALEPLLNLDVPTVAGRTLGEQLDATAPP